MNASFITDSHFLRTLLKLHVTTSGSWLDITFCYYRAALVGFRSRTRCNLVISAASTPILLDVMTIIWMQFLLCLMVFDILSITPSTYICMHEIRERMYCHRSQLVVLFKVGYVYAIQMVKNIWRLTVWSRSAILIPHNEIVNHQEHRLNQDCS